MLSWRQESKGSDTLRRAIFTSRVMCLIMFGAVTTGLLGQPGPSEEAEKLFNQKCANCHGKDGSGHTAAATKMTVPDLRSKRIREMSDEEIADSIGNGTKHYAYPHAFLHIGMTNDQITSLVKYIRLMQSEKKPAEKK
jgi:mono/diheme cytochrome c family protein